MIYVLDDSEAVLDVVAKGLDGLGKIETTTLWSELGGKLVRAGPHDLLVCDLHMAMMSGAAFCKIVRTYNQNVRIVFFTSTPQEAPLDLANAIVDKTTDGVAGLRRVVAALLRN